MKLFTMAATTLRCAALATAACVASTGSSSASEPASSTFWPTLSVTSEYSIGVLNGKAQEFVYNPGGSVLSRLDWTMDNVAMFNAATAVRVLPWLQLGLRGSMSLSDGGTMDDYDFNVFGCRPGGPGTLCHSNHPGTAVRSIRMLDIYGAFDFLRHSGFSLSALAGYKDDSYRWQAIGGTANYAALPPGLGISYEQNWSAPYIGLAFTASADQWTLRGRVIGSWWASGDDKDHHHLRSLLFTEEFSSTDMVSAEIGVGYRVAPGVSITADYRYQRWGVAKGPTTIYDLAGGGTFVIPGDSAGASNESHLISLGLKVALQPELAVAGSTKDEPYVRPALWSGWGVGVMGGYDWQQNSWSTKSVLLPPAPVLPNDVALDDSAQRAGIFAGYSWQRGPMVFGLEADLGRSNASATKIGIPGLAPPAILLATTDAISVTSGYDGSLRVRAGMLVRPSLLVYATGGLAFQQVKAALSCSGIPLSWCVAGPKYEEVSKTQLGWTVGAGYEVAFAGNWFTRGEYRYTSVGSFDHTFFSGVPIDAVTAEVANESHRLTFGLGYRF